MIPGEPEPLAIGIKKAPLSSRRRGFSFVGASLLAMNANDDAYFQDLRDALRFSRASSLLQVRGSKQVVAKPGPFPPPQ
jgi:hypothetical protein